MTPPRPKRTERSQTPPAPRSSGENKHEPTQTARCVGVSDRHPCGVGKRELVTSPAVTCCLLRLQKETSEKKPTPNPVFSVFGAETLPSVADVVLWGCKCVNSPTGSLLGCSSAAFLASLLSWDLIWPNGSLLAPIFSKC